MNTASSESLQAGVIIIGNEILSGRTQDANLAFIAKRLSCLGIELAEVRVIPDIEHRIIESVLAFHKLYTHVFTTGGIGPTHDDITSASIAKAFRSELIYHEEAVKILKERYGEEISKARLNMALIPEKAKLIHNPISLAPGFSIENVHVMAGVPEVMQGMFECLESTLTTGLPILSETIRCIDLGESFLAPGLGKIQEQYQNVEIGSYPFWMPGSFGVSIVVRGTNQTEIKKAAQSVADLMEDLGKKPIHGSG